MTVVPAPRPCGSCPYRRDVPAGIWDESEYAKLPPYDGETALQPLAAFFCHQQDGRLCAGWVACHGINGARGLLALRMLCTVIPEDESDQIVGYSTDVPLFGSGAEAAVHGLSGVHYPDAKARRVIDKLANKPRRREGEAT